MRSAEVALVTGNGATLSEEVALVLGGEHSMTQMTGVAKPQRVSTPLTRRFWEEADRGVLVHQDCTACGRSQRYPRALCAACCQPISRFTVAERPEHPGRDGDVHYVLALVQLDEGCE